MKRLMLLAALVVSPALAAPKLGYMDAGTFQDECLSTESKGEIACLSYVLGVIDATESERARPVSCADEAGVFLDTVRAYLRTHRVPRDASARDVVLRAISVHACGRQ
jgi:hypothetical protein